MHQSRITSKGQTTVPQAVREALDIGPGDRISYELKGDFAVVRRQPAVEAVFGSLAGKGRRRRGSAGPQAERRAARRAQVDRTVKRPAAKGTR
jgi:antitoxin PrlF